MFFFSVKRSICNSILFERLRVERWLWNIFRDSTTLLEETNVICSRAMVRSEEIQNLVPVKQWKDCTNTREDSYFAKGMGWLIVHVACMETLDNKENPGRSLQAYHLSRHVNPSIAMMLLARIMKLINDERLNNCGLLEAKFNVKNRSRTVHCVPTKRLLEQSRKEGEANSLYLRTYLEHRYCTKKGGIRTKSRGSISMAGSTLH